MSIYEQSDKDHELLFEERDKLREISRRDRKIDRINNQNTKREARNTYVNRMRAKAGIAPAPLNTRDTTNINSRQVAAQQELGNIVSKMDQSHQGMTQEERIAAVNKYEYNTRMAPGRMDAHGNIDMGIGIGDFKNATKQQLRQRAKTITFGGSGYKRQSFMNSLGMLQKHQKEDWTSTIPSKGLPPGAETKMVNDVLLYNKGPQMMTAFMTYGMSAWMLSGTGRNGSNISDTPVNMIGFSGFDIGAGIGWNLGGSLVEAGLQRYAAGALGAAVGGAGLGVAAYVIGDMALSPFASSDTWMHSIGHKVATKEFLDVSSTEEQRQHVSQRQRIYAKLSKNALNDRGQFMGNEAMALRGII